HKLVNVIKVQELDAGRALETEVMMVRVSCEPAQRGELGGTAGLFGARMVDLTSNTISFEISGTPRHLGDFLDQIRPYGIVDLVKSGRSAMKQRSEKPLTLTPTATRPCAPQPLSFAYPCRCPAPSPSPGRHHRSKAVRTASTDTEGENRE